MSGKNNNKLLNEIIGNLQDYTYSADYDCVIDDHLKVLKKHNIEPEILDCLEICDVCGDQFETKAYLDDFIPDYYESIIKSVCNILETYKTEV